MTARDYAEFGAYEEAVAVLSQCDEAWPMLFYYKAYYLGKMGKDTSYTLLQASQCSTDYCFPNKLEDILVLEYVVRENVRMPMHITIWATCTTIKCSTTQP